MVGLLGRFICNERRNDLEVPVLEYRGPHEWLYFHLLQLQLHVGGLYPSPNNHLQLRYAMTTTPLYTKLT